MKKKYIILALICIAIISLGACVTSCIHNKTHQKLEEDKIEKEKLTAKEPDLSQIRSICELATLECYYHNVAKSKKTKGSGLIHVGEKTRTFWIEYTGVAKIGVDMSEVKMNIEGTNITITIPNAKLITYKVQTISKDNYILSEDGWNKNPITADNQTKAIADAQEEMKMSVESNTSLLVRAQERAKTLIENYITRLGEASSVEYTINWEYSDN